MKEDMSCMLQDEDFRTLRAFCVLLQNGGMDAFKNALELGRLYGTVRSTVAGVVASGLAIAVLWLIVWGVLWYVKGTI